MSKELTADEIIDALGGTNATAELCNVKPPSVSDWRKTGIPDARLMFLKLARPDVFAAKKSKVHVVSPVV
jgi:ABC-type hemin transport system substrate-binding protein